MSNNDFRTDYALKNFIFFLVFSSICAFCIMKILLPQMLEYKKQAYETKKSKVAFNQINKDYLAIEAQLKTLSIEKYKTLSNLYNQGDETRLQDLLQSQFNAIEIKKLNSTKDHEVVDTRYQITGYVLNTQTIEDFITWVNTMPYFAKVELPIKMEFDKKNKYIYFIMIISLRHSVYKEHQIILDNQLRFDYFKP